MPVKKRARARRHGQTRMARFASPYLLSPDALGGVWERAGL